MDTSLVKYDAMCVAIADAHEIDEVNEIRNQAMALEAYAKQAKNFEAEKQVREIRLRAERRCGELLKLRHMSTGARGLGRPPIGGKPRKPPKDQPQTLAELGISKLHSSAWQKIADIPEDVFENVVKQTGMTTSNLVSIAEKQQAQRTAYQLKKEAQYKNFVEREEHLQLLGKRLKSVGRALDRIEAEMFHAQQLVDKIGLAEEQLPIGIQQELNNIAAKYRLIERWLAGRKIKQQEVA